MIIRHKHTRPWSTSIELKIKHLVCSLVLGVLLALSTSCREAGANPESPGKVSNQETSLAATNPAKPVAVDTNSPVRKPNNEAPLLLDDGPAEEITEGGADNSRCQVCHVNFMEEELTKTHAKAGIGCAKCHGECDAHIADESWASGGNGTAPDRMFPKDKINAFCLECHPQGKINAAAHQEFFAKAGGKSACVDCHGQHRMAVRKCRWKSQ